MAEQIYNPSGNLGIGVQQNELQRMWEIPLEAEIGYRGLANSSEFPVAIGESITRTRGGLLPTVTEALNPSTITNLDDGLTPDQWFAEQYTLTINEYAQTLDLNKVGSRVAIADTFVQNTNKLGEAAARSLDLKVRRTLTDAYLGGNTRITLTLGSPNVTVNVDDINGFMYAIPTSGASQGKPYIPVSGSNTMPVNINGTVYTLVGVAADTTNVSSLQFIGDAAPAGISGTLTFSTTVSVANATAGNFVVSAYAPRIIRPNNKSTTNNLISTDFLTLKDIRKGVTTLRNSNIPSFNGKYMMVMSPESWEILFNDPEFQLLFRGTEFNSKQYRNMRITTMFDVNFVITNLAPIEYLNGLYIQRPFLCGDEVVLEGIFDGARTVLEDPEEDIYDIVESKDIYFVNRKPIDRIKHIIAQSWFFIGGWNAPTDQTANPTTIPTSSYAYYKRGVFFEHV